MVSGVKDLRIKALISNWGGRLEGQHYRFKELEQESKGPGVSQSLHHIRLERALEFKSIIFKVREFGKKG